MADIQTADNGSVEPRINEAEVYRSMGLLDESLSAYRRILSDASGMDDLKQEKIREKIRNLEKQIALKDTESRKGLSDEDITFIKKTLSIHEDTTAVLDSAVAFQELGLFAEAASEYENLFALGYPPQKIIPDLTKCYLKLHAPDKCLDRMNDVLARMALGDTEKARATFVFGLEMENRGHTHMGVELYRSAAKWDPGNPEIADKLKVVQASLSMGSRYDYLLDQSLVTTEQLKRALALSKKMQKSVELILIEQFRIKASNVGKSLSLYYGCPFRGYSAELPSPVELVGHLKKSFLLHDIWVPLSWDKNGVEILVDDPKDLHKIDNMRALIKAGQFNLSVGFKEDIEKFIRRFLGAKAATETPVHESTSDDIEMMPDIFFEDEDEAEEDEEEFDEANSKVVKLVDHLIVAAHRKDASDIHIEPSAGTKTTAIRFRMDGLCHEYMTLPITMARGLISRVKIMSGLDIAERRLPQDGKIKFRRKGIAPFEMRVATLPNSGGYEDAVLRLLATAGPMKLDQMALTDRNRAVLERIIAMPYGMVLAVGPTGSGKTTSLHAALRHINKPGIKIWTAEDPVEITQEGLRQVEVKPKIGLDFARVMRSFLRADPDVIMIGEMRDEETAAIAIEASLTGHLVFSTLHTNSAPETVTRLLDMGMNPLNFSDAFLGVLAQRLVRRICPECSKAYHPSREEFDEIAKDYGPENFEKTGIKYDNDLKLYKTGGCDECSGTGYRGRLGIHELMDGTPEVKLMIKKQAPTEDIFTQGFLDGMSTLKQDGILKVFQGLTDIREIRRVCIR